MGVNKIKVSAELELKECPFCKGDAKLLVTNGFGDDDYDKIFYDVGCTTKDCYMDGGAEWREKNPIKIVEMWNNRTNK